MPHGIAYVCEALAALDDARNETVELELKQELEGACSQLEDILHRYHERGGI